MLSIQKIINIGKRPNYLDWENKLIGNINITSVVAFFNVTLSYFLFPLLGINDFQNIFIFSIIAAPVVVYLNGSFGYILGAYSFYFIGVALVTIIAVQLGADSYFINFYFPMALSVIHYFGRKETIMHTYILLLFFFISMLFVAYSYNNDLFLLDIEEKTLHKIKIFNILLSFFTGIVLVLMITLDNIKNEKTINKMLKEKDILIAEVFHRVKNNMNIVTSLLNLKKENSTSEEVKDAIEECRNRVFSMALVHQKIFSRNNISTLNFSDYINSLVTEITRSMGNEETTEITINAEDIELPLNYAIPCGLILNELITNSYKHAKTLSKKLIISVSLTSDNGIRKLIVADNGPGIQKVENVPFTSLGMELIDSLCNQIDGKYSFENKNGLYFALEF